MRIASAGGWHAGARGGAVSWAIARCVRGEDTWRLSGIALCLGDWPRPPPHTPPLRTGAPRPHRTLISRVLPTWQGVLWWATCRRRLSRQWRGGGLSAWGTLLSSREGGSISPRPRQSPPALSTREACVRRVLVARELDVRGTAGAAWRLLRLQVQRQRAPARPLAACRCSGENLEKYRASPQKKRRDFCSLVLPRKIFCRRGANLAPLCRHPDR